MLFLNRSKNENVSVGAKHLNYTVPLSNTVIHIGEKNVRLGYESRTSNGENSTLLSFSRDDAKSLQPHNQLSVKKCDKPLLEEFFKILNITEIKNFNNLKRVIKELNNKFPQHIEEIAQFISFVKNGAFFKHWADHYTKQAQDIAKSLGLNSAA
jgi:hypothetical protein